MSSTPTKRYTATMVTSHGHDGHRARPARRAEDRQQLRLPGPLPLLRRHHLPPDHPRLRAPGRRPRGLGPGGPGYRFADELPKAGRYEVGSLAMANAGPNTNGSQFFIDQRPDGVRLPPQYSLFGEVVTGLDVVEKINNVGSRSGAPTEQVVIESVTIEEKD